MSASILFEDSTYERAFLAGELEEAGADWIVGTIPELTELLLSL